jgi:hypothetical protein
MERLACLCSETYSFYNKEEVKAIAKEMGIPVSNKLKDQLCREMVKKSTGVEGVGEQLLRDPVAQMRIHQDNELAIIMRRFIGFTNSFYKIFYALAEAHGVFVLDDSQSYAYLVMNVQFEGAQNLVNIKVLGYNIGGCDRVALVGPKVVLDPLKQALERLSLVERSSSGSGQLSLTTRLLYTRSIMALILELLTLPGFMDITALKFCYHLEGVRSPRLRPLGYERNSRSYVDHCVDVWPGFKEIYFAPSAKVWEEVKQNVVKLPAEWNQFHDSVLNFYRIKVPFNRMAEREKQKDLVTQLFRDYQQAIQQFNQLNAGQAPLVETPNDLAIARAAGRIIHTPGVLDQVAKKHMELNPLQARNHYLQQYNEGQWLELLQEIADTLKGDSASV